MAIVKTVGGVPVLGVSGPLGRPSGVGNFVLGESLLGEFNIDEGLFRRDGRWRTQRIVKMKHYWPANPRTESQQSRRSLFASGIEAYLSLSADDKLALRREGSRRRLTGLALFMKRWLS